MAVSGSLTCRVNLRETISQGVSSFVLPLDRGANPLTISSGTGANQFSKVWQDSFVLNASPTTLDLTALSRGFELTAVSFTKIKLLYLYFEGDDGEILTVGDAASDPWYAPWSGATVTETVHANSPLLKTNLLEQASNAWSVDGTHKNLLLDPGALTLSVTIIVAGV